MSLMRWRAYRARRRGQVAVEAAVAAPLLLFLFMFAVEIALLVNAHILAQYAAYAVARCAIVSPQGDLDAYAKGEGRHVAAVVMGGYINYFAPGAWDAAAAAAKATPLAERRCTVSVRRSGNMAYVTVDYAHPVIVPGFRRYAGGSFVTVRGRAALPVVKYVP